MIYWYCILIGGRNYTLIQADVKDEINIYKKIIFISFLNHKVCEINDEILTRIFGRGNNSIYIKNRAIQKLENLRSIMVPLKKKNW